VNESSSQQDALIREIAGASAQRPGALLPILHEVQERLGHVPASAVGIVADVLNLSRAEVHGVVSFYHLFRQSPPGRQTLFVCRAEACQAMGGREIERYVRDRLGIDFHQTTPDGRFSLEPVYCLGNCACSPAVMIDETVHGRVTPQKLDVLFAEQG
jgi:formate dehydrogenase subunit gamma